MPLANDVRMQMGKTNPSILVRVRHFFKHLTMRKAIENPYVLAGAVFVLSALVLLLLRPPFTQKKDPVTQGSTVSFVSVGMIALLCASVVGLAGYFCRRR